MTSCSGCLPVVVLAIMGLVYAEKVRYDGHKVYQFTLHTDEQLELLQELQQDVSLDFWTGPYKNRPMDVHVFPEDAAAFLRILDNAGIQYHVAIDNIQELIDTEERENQRARQSRDLTWSRKNVVNVFARPDEIDTWMDKVARESDIASVKIIGTTYEGRPISLMKLSSGDAKKPAIFVDGGIHAREWLSQATVVWIINQIVTNYGSDAAITSLVDRFDWYLLPVANPDGYEYSHSQDRMWRKNRSENKLFSFACRGADPNRNFDYPKFGGPNTSKFICADTYRGHTAFSEAESAAIRDAILEIKDSLKLYVNLHAFGNFWFMPWSFDKNIKADDASEMERLAHVGADALEKVRQTKYRIGTTAKLLYPTGGATIDWAKGVAGVPYAYALELPPRMDDVRTPDSALFLAKPKDIAPCGQEVLEAFSAMLDDIHSRGV